MFKLGAKKKVGGGELHSVNPTCMVNELEIIKAYVVIININGFACCVHRASFLYCACVCVCIWAPDEMGAPVWGIINT